LKIFFEARETEHWKKENEEIKKWRKRTTERGEQKEVRKKAEER
jgi:hypothetical protein